MRLLALRSVILLLGAVPAVCLAKTCHTLNSRISGVQVCYRIQSRALDLRISATNWRIPLVGYGASVPQIYPLMTKTNDLVVSYIDLAGVSAGGSVRILLWKNGALMSTCQDRLYANMLRIIPTKNELYIALMQHYTGNFYYASAIINVNQNGVAETDVALPWHQLINYYKRRLNNVNDSYAKSIYLAFIASAYIHANDSKNMEEYVRRSKSESSGANGFLNALPEISKESKETLRSSKWCQPIQTTR